MRAYGSTKPAQPHTVTVGMVCPWVGTKMRRSVDLRFSFSPMVLPWGYVPTATPWPWVVGGVSRTNTARRREVLKGTQAIIQNACVLFNSISEKQPSGCFSSLLGIVQNKHFVRTSGAVKAHRHREPTRCAGDGRSALRGQSHAPRR